MKLVKLVKAIYHVYAKNNELQYSFWDAGDHDNNVTCKCRAQEWCNMRNAEEGYEKYTCEVVNLYGEATKW